MKRLKKLRGFSWHKKKQLIEKSDEGKKRGRKETVKKNSKNHLVATGEHVEKMLLHSTKQ